MWGGCRTPKCSELAGSGALRKWDLHFSYLQIHTSSVLQPSDPAAYPCCIFPLRSSSKKSWSKASSICEAALMNTASLPRLNWCLCPFHRGYRHASSYINSHLLQLLLLPPPAALHNRIHLKNSMCQSDSLFLLLSEASQQTCLYAEMSSLAKEEPSLILVNSTASSC